MRVADFDEVVAGATARPSSQHMNVPASTLPIGRHRRQDELLPQPVRELPEGLARLGVVGMDEIMANIAHRHAALCQRSD